VDLAASIVTAAATAALAVLAFFQIRAGAAQTDAAAAIARESRAAAERQWQPRVFAHAWQGPELGDGDNVAPGEMAVAYYLGNEGTGPAFNVEHGVDVGRIRYPWIGQYRTMRAGEQIPPMLDSIGTPVQLRPIQVGVPLDKWNADDYRYWTRFENLLGERFEVLNFPDPNRPAEFKRLSETPSGA
jgi:hypothetical protein